MTNLFNVLLLTFFSLALGAQDGPMGWASLNGGTTGGEGGEVIEINTRAQLRANVTGDDPKILIINDTIELTLYERVRVDGNKTIVGSSPAAMIRFGGLEILGDNVIVQNLAIGDFYDGDPTGTTNSTDCLTIYGENVWVDHCFLWSAADGLLDVRSGNGSIADYVTVSYTRFSDHNKVTLVGSSNNSTVDRDHLRVTFHHCWYDGTTGKPLAQRMPRVRFGDVHIFNNYYEETASYCVAARIESDVVVESTYFRNLKNPHIIDDQGIGLEDPDLVSIDNIYEGVTGSRSTNGVAFLPENFYSYTVTPTNDVPALVMNEAGPFNYPDNIAPVAIPDSVDYSSHTGAVIVDATQNDRDTDGGDLRIAQLANDPPGQVLIRNNAITYSPPNDATGVDTLLYILVDTQGGVDTGRVLFYFEGLPTSTVPVYGESELISISPNPVSGIARIELAPSIARGTIQIVSVAGQRLPTDVLIRFSGEAQFQLDSGGLPTGVYILSVATNKGVFTKRLVITNT